MIVRTLDIGGDKQIPYLNLSKESNPFLGQRAIRLCLANPELLITQLRALLRASSGYPVRIMFPMISTLPEIRKAKEILQTVRQELSAEKKPFNEAIEVGMMVEIPSAALLAKVFVKEIDFFSIGTNDLSQYTLAADRTNKNVSYLADCLDPSVLLLIKKVIEAGHDQKKRVGVCGEMAGQTANIQLLLGLGVDELSMNPPNIPLVKEEVRRIHTHLAREAAVRILASSDIEEVIGQLRV